MFEEDGTACASLGAVILDQHDNENAQQRAGGSGTLINPRQNAEQSYGATSPNTCDRRQITVTNPKKKQAWSLGGHGIVQRPKVSWQHELQQTAQYDGRDRRRETKKQLRLRGLGVGFKPNIHKRPIKRYPVRIG